LNRIESASSSILLDHVELDGGALVISIRRAILRDCIELIGADRVCPSNLILGTKCSGTSRAWHRLVKYADLGMALAATGVNVNGCRATRLELAKRGLGHQSVIYNGLIVGSQGGVKGAAEFVGEQGGSRRRNCSRCHGGHSGRRRRRSHRGRCSDCKDVAII